MRWRSYFLQYQAIKHGLRLRHLMIYFETHASSERADDDKESFCGDKSCNPGAREEEQVVQRHAAHAVQMCQFAVGRFRQQRRRDAHQTEE